MFVVLSKLNFVHLELLEEQDRVTSPWTCEVCTYINEPYIKTGKDVCEMCEGPSPLKRCKLINSKCKLCLLIINFYF